VQSPLLIGIAGGTGSGKTTVAKRLQETLGDAVALIDHDSYYLDQSTLPAEERKLVNYDHPDTLDNELLLSHLVTLKQGSPIKKPLYDFKTHTRTSDTFEIAPAPVIIVEGILTLAQPKLRAVMDLKVFVDTAADIRLMRRIRRDLEQRGRSFESIRAQYYETVRPMHNAFVEPSKEHADMILPEGGRNEIAISVLVGMIRNHVSQR
jgi:uridine kinase